jgi:hypothetical protein
MQIILGIIFLFLLIFIIAKIDILTPRAKTVVFTLLMMLLATAIVYESMLSKTEQNNRDLINAFNQGKTLICKSEQVNQKDYNLERGTMSFMPKPEINEISGALYSIEDCAIK